MPTANAKILIVDDDLIILKFLTRFLKDTDFVITTTENVPDAIDAIDNTPPAIIITDIKMPGQDGTAILEYVSEQNLSIPCIVMSGHEAEDAMAPEHQALCAKFLSKPFSGDLLLKSIEEVLK